MNKLISTKQLNKNDISILFKLIEDIQNNVDKYKNILDDKILINVFFESSTRTSLSFQTAMLKLGGKLLNFGVEFSSINKGETFSDTIKVIENYADILIVRHSEPNLLEKINTDKIIINAGDGNNEHPTQALIDLYTIYKSFEKTNTNNCFNNMVFTFVGDLKNSRPIHSIIYTLIQFTDITFNLISPCELKLPDYLLNLINNSHNKYTEDIDFKEYLSITDVFYMTRIQKERFDNIETYSKYLNYFCLKKSDLEYAKGKMIILHPLPRVNEIDHEIDYHKSAKYFLQVKLGVFVRMGIILYLFNKYK